MSTRITIEDRLASNRSLGQLTILLVDNRVTLRQLIEARIRHEVAAFNAHNDGAFNGLVEPKAMEALLNDRRAGQAREVDADRQVACAIEGFGSNAYVVLIDDRQADSLDEMVELTPDTEIAFVRLTPLVGG